MFFDTGHLWLERGRVSFDPRAWRHALGVAGSYETPVGPISVHIGFNLNRRINRGERPFTVDINIGNF